MSVFYPGLNIFRIRFFTEISPNYIMESCSSGPNQEICWFCRKGRHEECMKQMPVDAKSEGPHDCAFDTKMVPCKCSH
jgi:hypothetical protein